MDDSNVYRGVWTNWSRGPILGQTLTTSERDGNLLLSFTAFFIALVAARFWRIFCFVLHRIFSDPTSRDPIYTQRQILLRNSSSPESGIASFMRLLMAWRTSQRPNQLIRTLGLILFSICFAVIFTVAGGFSSSIATAVGDEVLIKSSRCGFLQPNDNATEAIAWWTYMSGRVTDAANYAQQCYDETSTYGILECGRFVKKRLPVKQMDTNASCPFDNKICRNEYSNIRLDTGYINSNTDLGLNAPPDQQFSWRYVLQCAPLRTEGYSTQIVENNQSYVRYNYGPIYGGTSDNKKVIDFTYQIEDIDYQYPNFENVSYLTPQGKNYKMMISADGQFNARPELARDDGNVGVVFLSGNGVVFSEKVDDDWYQATAPYRNATKPDAVGQLQTYHPKNAASPLGCVEQWQWCNSAYPPGEGCGPLTALVDAAIGASPLFNVSADVWNMTRPSSPLPSAARLVWPFMVTFENPTYIDNMIQFLGVKSLQSQVRLNGGVQWPLPKNQWQLDVAYWFNTVLAAVQASFVDTALQPEDPVFENFRWGPENEEEQEMCQMQKVRSTAYTSFSLFGIVFTYVAGILIVLVSYALEPIFACLHRRLRYRPYAYLEWTNNASLQLHRLANDALGVGDWSNCTNEVPRTMNPDPAVAYLDISDPRHPVFCRPGQQVVWVEKEDSAMRKVSISERIDSGFTLGGSGSEGTTIDSRVERGHELK